MVSKQPLTPFFSVITCTRNSAHFLKACLTSVKSQTFHNFEFIVVDGYSTDQTKSILKKSGIAPISAEPAGISAAMNAGIQKAKGKYIFFLHSDDSFYHPNVLQDVHSFLTSHQELDWAFGRIHEVTGKGQTVGFPPKRKIFQGKHPTLLKFYNYIPHQAVFMKKAVFDKYGTFDESLKSMMDDELWLRLKDKTEWGYMPIVVANYSIRAGSQSESPEHALANTQEYELVQSRYLNKIELVLAKLINRLLR